MHINHNNQKCIKHVSVVSVWFLLCFTESDAGKVCFSLSVISLQFLSHLTSVVRYQHVTNSTYFNPASEI